MARVLVTGCSSGIGKVTAEVLAGRGHDVVATARRVEALRGLPVAACVPLDVTDDAGVDAAFAAALDALGGLDAVVNNAGVAARGPLEATPAALAAHLFDVNVVGVLRVVRRALPVLRAAGGGTIVNMSSLVGRVALPFAAAYSATKFALEGLSDAVRVEVAHLGVRVVLVEPGLVDTGAFESSPAADELDGLDALYPLVPSGLGAAVPAREVGEAVAAAIESARPPARVVVGDGARRLLSARAAASDDELDALLASTLVPRA